ncbi:MAG: hypothetical protein FWD42_07465 [Solirubrobacterales bacterium]|nr:hypothetical protein [Solirubrobacterales bacterium]
MRPTPGRHPTAHPTTPTGRSRLGQPMPPTWIWMQVAIVVVVLIGMIVAITKLV